MFQKKSNNDCLFDVFEKLVALVLFVTTIIAFVGMYKAHVLNAGLTFGTTSGSLSIIAFLLSFLMCIKQFQCCCKIDKKK